MIQKAYEINKLDLSKYNLYLFYGENEGYKNEIIKNKFEKNYPNQIYRYDEKDVLNKKNEFFESIISKSFFENKRIIIISRVSDKIKDIIEKEKNTVCIAFYADTIQTLNGIANIFFKEKKISISQQTINLLVERCRGNRENLKNELIKIENYSKSRKKITNEEILKLTNLAENYNTSELVDNCLAKNTKKTATILNENNYSNEDCILIIRTFLSKTKRLLKLQEEVKNNISIDQAITNFKPPIFWKDKEIIRQQMTQWTLEKINKMIINIIEIELLVKKNSSNSLNILSDFIINQANKSNS